ncbi:hypothetical protein [Nocardia sp. NPDC049149]|uniref:hypothetical protein n=1 Tax=Nocardia sp. NPDC049149 TaxID=3364315 RepID=UPI00371561B2
MLALSQQTCSILMGRWQEVQTMGERGERSLNTAERGERSITTATDVVMAKPIVGEVRS